MRTERILFIFFVLGLLLKFSDLPFAGPLLVVTLPTIAMLYCPGAFYFFSDKEISRQNIPLSVGAGLVLSIVTIGILFKLMYWPGAQSQLFLGVVLAPIVFILVLVFQSKAKEELKKYYQQMVLRMTIWTVLGVSLYMTPKESLIEFQHRNNPELARLKIQSYSNPDNVEYKKQLEEYYIQERKNRAK